MIRKLGTLAMTIAVALPLAAASPAGTGQSAPNITSEGAPSADLPLADYQAFDQFSAAHPEIIRDLGHHPELIDDPGFLASHRELRDFLGSHAELRNALISDPGNFIEPHRR